jgi:hypothetical protein
MDDDLRRSYARWKHAESEGHEEDADVLFGAIYRSVKQREPVAPRFTAGTMEAVARVAARDARRARRLRMLGLPAGVTCAAALVYLVAGHVGAIVSAIVVSALDLLIALVVGMATNGAGRDLSGLLSSLGRAAAALLADPGFTAGVLAIQGIAILALVMLQRLLRSDEELFR